jgi:hypothetical protein
LSFSKALSFALFSSMEIVIISKSRWRYIRFIVTSSGSSVTHGWHHVAQTLTRRSFLVSLAASALTAASSISEMLTGSAFHLARDFSASLRLSAHLVEQPKTLVFSTGTGRPASSASIALLASWFFGGFTSPSSIRPA